MNDGPNPLLVGPVSPEEINQCLTWAIGRADGGQPGAAFAQGVIVALSWLLGVSSWHPRTVCEMLENGLDRHTITAGLVVPGQRRGD